MAPASGTSRGGATSTWSSRTGRSSPATRIPPSSRPCSVRPPTAPATAPPPNGRCGWRRRSACPGAFVPDGAVGVERNRGDDVGHSGGARLHRPTQGGQVRRQLPRPRRPVAGRGGQRVGRPRPAGIGRGDGGGRPRHRRRPLQPGPDARRPDRLRHRRAHRRQHGPGPTRARVPGRLAGGVRSRRCAARLRRGDHGVPGRPGRGAGVVRRGAGPHDHGQGHRGRAQHRCLRRAGGRDGSGGAAGPRVPGRHAVGEPAGDGRRAGGARPARRRRLRRPAARRPRRWPVPSGTPSPPPA